MLPSSLQHKHEWKSGWVQNAEIIPFHCISSRRVSQIPGAKLPRELNFVQWCLIYVRYSGPNLLHFTLLVSRNLSGSKIFAKFEHPFLKVRKCTHLVDEGCVHGHYPILSNNLMKQICAHTACQLLDIKILALTPHYNDWQY